MSNKVIAIDPLTIDLLKAGKLDQAFMIHESRQGDPKAIEPFRRRTCSIDLLISDLLQNGKLEAAIEIYERYSNTPEALNSFTRKAFFNRARMKLLPFMLKRFDQLQVTIAPTILRNQITLAEMAGSPLGISEALAKFDLAFDSQAIAQIQKSGDSTLSNAANACLGIFNISQAIELTQLIGDTELRSSLEIKIENYFSVCQVSGFSAHDLPNATNQIRAGIKKKIDQPTVVVRITPNIWGALSKSTTFDDSNLPDGFAFAKYLKDNGYNVAIAPQLSLPGPSLHAPYSPEQPHPIAYVDSHKYSKTGKFIHYKSIGNGFLQVERGGYSGWSEITTTPSEHQFTNCDYNIAKSFCETIRSQVFGHIATRPDSFKEFGKYGLIPLQIPGDSVQRLTKFDYFEMIETSTRFFRSKGLNIVIRRHPQCQDREVSSFLKRLSPAPDIFITELSTRDLIFHSEAVSLCNSSVGWDAILAHKPLFCFGLSEYSRAAHLIEETSDIEEVENISEVVNPEQCDLLYHYFWTTQATKGMNKSLNKVGLLVERIFDEQKTIVKRKNQP